MPTWACSTIRTSRRPDSDGAFDIGNLPAGSYVIEAWHEILGVQTQNVTIGDGATAEVSFTFAVG